MSAATAFARAVKEEGAPSLSAILRALSFALFIAALALAPFPLGSNRPWSWSLLCLLLAACWLLWSLSVWSRPQSVGALARGLVPPLTLAVLALIWAVAQTLPVAPQAGTHPVWRMAESVLGKTMDGAISIAPWRTGTEFMKLATYGMAAWLARAFAERGKAASRLLGWLIAIGAFYCVYGFVLALLGRSQFMVFYGVRAVRDLRDLSGPFVNHNSYATYAGLVALAAGVRLVGGAWERAQSRSAGQGLLAVADYVFGRGAWWLAATILAVSTVLATGSRAGNFATFAAIAALASLGAMLAAKKAQQKLAALYVLVFLAAIAGLLAIGGARLLSGLDDIGSAGLSGNMRLMLWQAAWRMVRDAPFLGLGLGTYQAAYPLYAGATVPFMIDKAHNDYLELLAGWGFPAALCWWTALLWLAFLCARGILVRQRNRLYPMLGLGAVILVGIHSVFDFSLQMPAVALSFAAILGLGVAQSFPTRPDAVSAVQVGATSEMRGWLIGLLLPLPALVLVLMALPRLNAGIALEQAFPQSAMVETNFVLPTSSYARMDRILARAPSADAETQILKTEVALGAGRSPDILVPPLEKALSRAPADLRGWILLAALLKDSDPATAGKALSLAYRLGPYEYYLIPPRTAVGAGLWDHLPERTRQRLVADARLIATDPNRRNDLDALLARPGGAALATRALKGNPDAIRTLNQSLARETLHLPPL